jgi:DNA polymerase III delta prime subunit
MERLFDPPEKRPDQRPPPDGPLAARLRPQTLDEFVGQEHLLHPGSALRTALESGQPHSMVLYGPPGTGKTTLARLAAHYADALRDRSVEILDVGRILVDEDGDWPRLVGRVGPDPIDHRLQLICRSPVGVQDDDVSHLVDVGGRKCAANERNRHRKRVVGTCVLGDRDRLVNVRSLENRVMAVEGRTRLVGDLEDHVVLITASVDPLDDVDERPLDCLVANDAMVLALVVALNSDGHMVCYGRREDSIKPCHPRSVERTVGVDPRRDGLSSSGTPALEADRDVVESVARIGGKGGDEVRRVLVGVECRPACVVPDRVRHPGVHQRSLG